MDELKKRFSIAASKKKQVHVIPGKDGWSVKTSDSKKSSVIKFTKKEAIKAAEKLKTSDQIIVHEKSGQIIIKNKDLNG